ncbi:conserved Plasmodium protein, unknown function [Plasmodium ovale curtisi]|uniref:Leucine-rich repeat protein n=1 Tax=Plasmodium ovale curtisi TaxID=864141 RepID=A0A1A8WC50_PLAOA|nr:conserved Plasmodium protein, unknown function [Plasmodium ovale curtisi]
MSGKGQKYTCVCAYVGNMENSLTANYIRVTEQLRNGRLIDEKLKLEGINEHVDYDVIESFCDELKKNTTFSGELNISHNNLNEVNMFNIICSVHENKKITGLNVEGNKITKMIFNKILLLLEKENFHHLNIQSTQLNNQEIKNVIFSTLNNNIKSLKLPPLDLETFPFLIKHLKGNNSIERLHFLISHNQMNASFKRNDENVANAFMDYVHVNIILFKDLLEVVEIKENVKTVKCNINFYDDEIEELVTFINCVCERRANTFNNSLTWNDNKMKITSQEKMQLLMPDITGAHKHIEKFEREVQVALDADIIKLLQKMLP